jgi:hypothetical protein
MICPTGNVRGVTDFEIPGTGSATVHVLHEGHVGRDGDDERVSGTVTLIGQAAYRGNRRLDRRAHESRFLPGARA